MDIELKALCAHQYINQKKFNFIAGNKTRWVLNATLAADR